MLQKTVRSSIMKRLSSDSYIIIPGTKMGLELMSTSANLVALTNLIAPTKLNASANVRASAHLIA